MVSHWKLIRKKKKNSRGKKFGPLPSIGIVKSHERKDIPKPVMDTEKKRHEGVSSHAMDAAPL